MIDLNKLKAAAEAAKAYQPDAIKAHSFGCFDEEGIFYELGNVCARIYERDENSDGSAADDALLNHIISASPDAVLELISLASAAAPQVVADERAAFEAWCVRKSYGTNKWHGDGSSYTSSHTISAWEAWNARAAAPVQAHEPFMYGIMGPDGKAHIDENCVAGEKDSTALHIEVKCLNDLPDTGYSIVPLYTAPVQPVAVPDDWKLVPVEPTDKMRMATIHSTYHYEIDADWAAMLSAAPAAPAAQGHAKDSGQLNAAIYEGITKALGEYRMSNMCFADDESMPFPLVDLLSKDGGTIESGQQEIVYITDAVYNEVLSAIAAKAAS